MVLSGTVYDMEYHTDLCLEVGRSDVYFCYTTLASGADPGVYLPFLGGEPSTNTYRASLQRHMQVQLHRLCKFQISNACPSHEVDHYGCGLCDPQKCDSVWQFRAKINVKSCYDLVKKVTHHIGNALAATAVVSITNIFGTE